MRVVFVHGACVRDGEWWWHRTARELQRRGVTSTAPGLPSCGEGAAAPGAHGPGLTDDVAAVAAVLQDSAKPTVLVVHSYGGIVAAQAAVGAGAVRHALLVSSYLARPGESLSSFGEPEPAPFLDIDPDGGTFGVRNDALAATFLQDCPPDVVATAGSRLARQSLSVTQEPVSASAWQNVPTTYLVCTDDRGTPEAAQHEFARRADRVVDIAAGHHPFLSQPAAVADLVVTLT
ncbi:alpha/beta hydrolase [uncultured Jatrophihabitans sp.]|uniref:alpha/beta hydrolase n=1 Tax=uncultured Jatrophihabitans sp. TaxID=1610747 RepID=UPI0035CA5EC0